MSYDLQSLSANIILGLKDLHQGRFRDDLLANKYCIRLKQISQISHGHVFASVHC